MSDARVDGIIAGVVTVAASLVVLTVVYYPTQTHLGWWIAFGALFALSILSTGLALTITEGGTTTAMDFLPQLSAVLLLGPFGAVLLTALAEAVSQFLLRRKPVRKALFNVAQLTTGTATASITFDLLGGEWSLQYLPFLQTITPFLPSAALLFLTNAVCATLIISVSENKRFTHVWTNIVGSILLFDIAMSPVAYLVGLLYVNYGAVTLVLGVVPIVGLRYSYGVNLELQQLNRDLLRVLIKALEGRDPYTSGHSVRVADYAKQIATALGLSASVVRNIETAALLHDIGKIDPAYTKILQQAGSLTDEQFGLIREHPERGVDLIRSIRRIDDSVLKFVKHHHERWDGTGYPDELAGDDIPIGARVIMVADTIDAMSTARPYRNALDYDTIREELIEYRGLQFDPDVVEAALACDSIWKPGAPEEGPVITVLSSP